jgi:hypothetical protein
MVDEWGDWNAALRKERQDAKRAADNFARVCKEGRPDQLYDAHLLLNECAGDAWRLAMKAVARLPSVAPEIRDAFLAVWIESKMLPLRVGNRRVLANALRVLMAGYSGPPLTLYRGTSNHERRRRLYGFSWTTNIDIARKFAEHWAKPVLQTSGLISRTAASPEAIFVGPTAGRLLRRRRGRRGPTLYLQSRTC